MGRLAKLFPLLLLREIVSGLEATGSENQSGEQGAEGDQAENNREPQPGQPLGLPKADQPDCGGKPFAGAGHEQPLHEQGRQGPTDAEQAEGKQRSACEKKSPAR